MRRGGWRRRAVGLEILGWGQIAKRLVRPLVVEVMGEAIDEGLGAVDLGVVGRRTHRTCIARWTGRCGGLDGSTDKPSLFSQTRSKSARKELGVAIDLNTAN